MTNKAQTEVLVTIIAMVSPDYLSEVRDAVEQIRGYATIQKAEAIFKAETVVNLAD